MRNRLVPLLAAVLALAAGCGNSRLQSEVDAANRMQLALLDERSYIYMSWDDMPKDWILITDVRLLQGHLQPMHAMLTFHEGKLGIASRVGILEGQEIIVPGAGHPPSAETLAQRAERYGQADRRVAEGRKWAGATFTTSIHPKAVTYHEVGTVSYRGEPVRLLGSRVQTDRVREPVATYEEADQIVGLHAETGRLVFEYLVNRRPRPQAANRMLTVHDTSVRYRLNLLMELGAPERTAAYEGLHAELTLLEAELRMLIGARR